MSPAWNPGSSSLLSGLFLAEVKDTLRMVEYLKRYELLQVSLTFDWYEKRLLGDEIMGSQSNFETP